jgi:hypothetical protein
MREGATLKLDSGEEVRVDVDPDASTVMRSFCDGLGPGHAPSRIV